MFLFHQKTISMATTIRIFEISKTAEEIKEFSIQYFKANGYYQKTLQKGKPLCFTTYPVTNPRLHPQRYNYDIYVKIFENGGKSKVVIEFKFSEFGWTNWASIKSDKRFYEDFAYHFIDSIRSNEVKEFDKSPYVNAIEKYNRFMVGFTVGGILIAFMVCYLLKYDDFSILLIVFMLLESAAIWWVNRQLGEIPKPSYVP